MNQKSLSRIQGAASFLASPDAEVSRGYLDKPLETALRIVDCLSDGRPWRYGEMAIATGLAENTAKSIVRSLDLGGYPLKFILLSAAGAGAGRKLVAVQSCIEKQESGDRSI